MGRVIGILSLKGGVGKTSAVVSLGAAFVGFGQKVLLIDANFSAPNLGQHLNISSEEKNINRVIDNKIKPKEAIHNYGKLDVIPAGTENISISDPFKLKQRIRSLKAVYDVILIDSSPALNNETLTAMVASDELIVVVTPDIPTLSNTIRAVKLAKKELTPIIGLILNKVHSKGFEVPLKEIEANVDVPILAVIPYDLSIQKAQSEATPPTIYDKKSLSTEEYRKLAAALLGKRYKPKLRLRHLLKLAPTKQDINRVLIYDKPKETPK